MHGPLIIFHNIVVHFIVSIESAGSRDHRGGIIFLTYSLPARRTSFSKSSNRLSFLFRIHNNSIPSKTPSRRMCRIVAHKSQTIQEFTVRLFLSLHSRPVPICSLNAAISAVIFTIAASTFRLHCLVLRFSLSGPSYSPSSYSCPEP